LSVFEDQNNKDNLVRYVEDQNNKDYLVWVFLRIRTTRLI